MDQIVKSRGDPFTSNLAKEGTTTTAGTRDCHHCAALQRPQLSLFVLSDSDLSTMAQTNRNCWTSIYTSPRQMCGAQLGLAWALCHSRICHTSHSNLEPVKYAVYYVHYCGSLFLRIWTLLISRAF